MNVKNNMNKYDKSQFDDEIVSLLEEFSVDFPDEEHIDRTIEVLEQYVPEKKESFDYMEKIKYLLKRAAIDISFISMYYWIGIFVLYILGYIVTVINKGNPYATLISLSPVPIIIGVLEIFKGREEGVFEIEMACKISPNELVISRFILINFYSIILNTALTLVFIRGNLNANLWGITLVWLTPLIFMAGLAMIISIKMRGQYVSLILLSIWGSFGIALINMEGVLNKIIYVNSSIYFFIMLIGIGMIFYVFKKKMYMKNFMNKRVWKYDIKNS